MRRKRAAGTATSKFKPQPSRYLSDECFAEIEEILGLLEPDQALRNEIDFHISSYDFALRSTRPKRKALNRHLTRVAKAAQELYEQLTPTPAETRTITTARRGQKRNMQTLMSLKKLSDIEAFLERSNRVDHSIFDQRKVLSATWSFIQGKCRIDPGLLAKQLRRLSQSINSREKDVGGQTGNWAHNELMFVVAEIYHRKTGKEPTVSTNRHGGLKYGGRFVKLATIFDRETARIALIEPYPNLALGPRLVRVLERRRKAKPSN